MNVTVCNGTIANISCGFTGVYSPNTTRPNWRIIERNNNGIETVNWMNTSNNSLEWNITSSLKLKITTSGKGSNANDLSVGPVDKTYNNTSYQCIFTINDTIIESTVGTITVNGMCIVIS